jgi:hypothetical protein
MLGCESMARDCAANGRERVLELCTEEKRADRVEEIYRELLTARRPLNCGEGVSS